MKRPIRSALVTLVAVIPLCPAAEPTLQELDQKIRILERKLELAAESSTAATPTLSAGADGFALTSADRAFQLKFRGYLQADSRFYADDPDDKSADTFLIRRARLIFDAQLGRFFAGRMSPDFGNGKSELQDAYLDFTPDSAFNLRAGRSKVPFGLERLQPSSDTFLNETALSTALTPNYDVGLQAYGNWGRGWGEYTVGVFNGCPDGASADSDTQDEKDFTARLLFNPFKHAGPGALKGLSVGLAGTLGDREGSATSPQLPVYRTAGQQSYFSYKTSTNPAATAFADGTHLRLSPQLYYAVGSFGLLAEYILSEQEVVRGETSESLDHAGWQVTATTVLTGESPSLKGIKPLRPFNPAAGDWGAIELVARFSSISLDDRAFDAGLADPQKSASAADAYGAGINWFVTRNAKLALQYEQTIFTDGAAEGDRPDEKVLIARAQIAF